MFNIHQTSNTSKVLLTSGYSEIIEDRFNAGWSCDLLTVLFNRMTGSQPILIDQMKDQVHRIYSTLATRVNRKPRQASSDELPLLIGALDLPVYKKDRTSAPTIVFNDGLHFHGILMVPPNSRLKTGVGDHFSSNADLYSGASSRVARIDVRTITHSREHVMDYVLKTIKNKGLSYDDAMIVLPRSKAELGD